MTYIHDSISNLKNLESLLVNIIKINIKNYK